MIALPRWAWGMIATGGLLTAAALWLHFHDRAVIRSHEADVSQAVATQTAAAIETALTNDADRAADRASDNATIREAIRHAETTNPAAARAAAGPATRAAADSLRARARTDRHAAD